MSIDASSLKIRKYWEITFNTDLKTVTTTVKIFHILGHSKSTSFTVPIDSESYMNEPQKWASAATFTKRNAFCNAYGIITGDSDDDGNVLGNPKEEKKIQKEKANQIN